MIILALLLDGFIFQSGYAAAVSVRTHTDFLSVTWTPPRPPPDTWNVRYQVTGTSYHSALLVPGTQSAANISSTDYPGSLYAVHVFANNNGTRTPYGVGYGRSDCSHTIAASIGETYVLESPGYPYGLPSGVVCVWTVAGTADTWYTVDADDVDINAGGGCGNVLRIDNRTVCGNDTNMRTLYIPSDVMHWTLITKNRHDGRGFRFNVTAVHKIDSPGNVTAATVGQAIHVTWSEPVHHPANFSYIVRVSHYPYTATVDVAVPPSRTQYVVDVGRHAGQMYSIQVQAATDVWSSPYTAAVTVDTACDRDIHIAPTEAVTLTSAQYPFSYLPGIHCRYDITTDVGFYLRLDTADISLAGGPGCRHSYLAVGDYGTFCTANPPDSRHVVASGRVKMEFVTGDNATGRGFNITITAVARPPLPPTGVRSQVGHGELCVTWVPPARRRQYVTGYRLQYWVVPHTPGATLQLPADTRNVTVGTRDHPGRVYVLRVAAVTAGGAGRYSAPTYARASCGSAITLTRHHKGLIISPSGQKGLYQPGVVCKWAIVTDSPLAIKLHFDKLNIESSVNCSKDFLAVTDHGRLCGNMTGREYVIHGTRVELMFATDLTAEQQGFVVSAAAVGPTPGMPTNVTVYRSKYALIISWNPPLLHRAYVSGYILSYTVRPDRRIYTKSLPARDHTAAVDITDWPGRQVHVWMQAQGDIATSNKTETLSFRIACGETINTTHGIFYIASPHYPTAYQNDVYCKWSIDVGQPVDIMLTLIRIDLTNQQNNCTDFLAISGQRRFCDDSHQNMPVAVYSVRSLDVEFHTDTDGVGTGFLLSVEILPHTDTVTTPLTLTSSNGAPSIRPTPSSTFAGPTGALLATSLLTTNAFLNSSDFIVPATLTTGYHPATSSIGDPHTRRNRQSKLLGIHMHSSEIDSVILSPSYENNRASRIYTDSSVLLNKALSAHIQGTESASNLFTKMYSIHEHTIVSSTTNVTTIARKIPMELKTYQTLLYVEGVITHGNIHPTTSTRRDISAECSCTVPHSHDQCRRQCWTEYTHGTTHHLRSPTELVTSTIPDTSPSRGLPSDYTSTVGPVNNGCRYSHTCVICWTIFTLLYQTSQIK